jgi:hypothetical protein
MDWVDTKVQSQGGTSRIFHRHSCATRYGQLGNARAWVTTQRGGTSIKLCRGSEVDVEGPKGRLNSVVMHSVVVEICKYTVVVLKDNRR